MVLLFNSIFVFFGAGLGGCARYWFSLIFGHASIFSFSLAILSVNVLGAFLAGVMAVVFAGATKTPFFLCVVTGFLGGFTTFSAFTFEGMKLLQAQPLMALGHAAMHVLGCLFAFYVGSKTALWAT